MEPVDWLVVLVLLGFIFWGNRLASREKKSVADFLAANRCVGQYLLAVGEWTAGLGAVTVVAYLERGYTAGFVPTYWQLAQTPLDIVIRVTGFVRYRYRMTKAMTMAQFFEMRYSKSLRIYAGFICWISGVINMGIFPVSAAWPEQLSHGAGGR